MNIVPPQYKWLSNEPGPNVLKEALKLYGVAEIKGGKHNPEIISWAKEINPEVVAFYKSDEIAWCGLFMAVCLKRAGWIPPKGYDALRAMRYAQWGRFVPPGGYCVGDIGVFSRTGGGHVGLLVGYDHESFHVLGGNQGDRVCVTRITLDRLYAVSRPDYRVFKPRYLPMLRPSGGLSENEA